MASAMAREPAGNPAKGPAGNGAAFLIEKETPTRSLRSIGLRMYVSVLSAPFRKERISYSLQEDET